jgi:hypothetical protein
MKDMKLIMESWRQYSSHKTTIPMVLIENGEIICFDLNERLRTLNESSNAKEINILFEKWLVQTEAILNEGVISDFFGDVKEKAAQLTGKAKQFFIEFMEDPYLALSLQLWSFLQKIKNVGISALAKAAGIVSKINAVRESFKNKNPLLYAILAMITKVAIVAIVAYAVSSLLGSSDAQAAYQTGEKLFTADSEGFQEIIGVVQKDNPDMARQIAKMIDSPDVNTINDLSDGMKRAIVDALESVNSVKRDIERFKPVGLHVQDEEKLKGLAEAGKEILNQVAEYNNSNLKKMADKWLKPDS